MFASSTLCPQCRLGHCIDCLEPECPGQKGFVPASWQRPLLEISADLQRYESLILQADEYFAAPGQASNIALMIGHEAQAIRAKKQKETPAAPAAQTPASEPFTLV